MPFKFPALWPWNCSWGCLNQGDLQRTQKFLNAFEVAWPTAAEFEQAHGLLAKHRLSSGLSIPDYLIAAMALSRSARVYTFNLKHFQVITGLDAQTPYTR